MLLGAVVTPVEGQIVQPLILNEFDPLHTTHLDDLIPQVRNGPVPQLLVLGLVLDQPSSDPLLDFDEHFLKVL